MRGYMRSVKVGKELARGTPVQRGRTWGAVRVIPLAEHDPPQKLEALRVGEILVTTRTTPEHEPWMARAIGFVADTGGMTSHIGIYAREHELPTIAGASPPPATSVLETGQEVVVDGGAGRVYEYLGGGEEVDKRIGDMVAKYEKLGIRFKPQTLTLTIRLLKEAAFERGG